MHGLGHANDEGEDGHDDEHHEGTGIHQLGQVSSVDGLTFHSTGNFLPPPSQVPNATSGSIQWVTGPA